MSTDSTQLGDTVTYELRGPDGEDLMRSEQEAAGRDEYQTDQ